MFAITSRTTGGAVLTTGAGHGTAASRTGVGSLGTETAELLKTVDLYAFAIARNLDATATNTHGFAVALNMNAIVSYPHGSIVSLDMDSIIGNLYVVLFAFSSRWCVSVACDRRKNE